MAAKGFHLHKWASNEPTALGSIPAERRAAGTEGGLWKTLGIFWDRKDDCLTFVPPGTTRQDGQDSKRQLLSTASRVFDPVGCLALFTVMAKILFQSLWQLRVPWDEPLPEDVEQHWNRWKRELAELSLIRVPRALVPVTLAQVNRIELHAFCDASELAYGAVVYLRLETSGRLTLVNFITAKTRVAPVKRLTLPRLEIMGALLAAQGEERTSGHATLAVMMTHITADPLHPSRYGEIENNLDAAGAKGRVQTRNQNTPQGRPRDGAQPLDPYLMNPGCCAWVADWRLRTCRRP
ncbi:hypothetical protein T10_9429 [Trichinella papuae]|uniref:Reverse transcriptase/retrotransposon-derived protein RNase H-like domain-containing protein n=1 Tax=Trichinella papuae TaxID=268474 RepID=A0A0V1MH61_9BILA|nr:hypothetical protein T10_9429 [Trichinella papuae]